MLNLSFLLTFDSCTYRPHRDPYRNSNQNLESNETTHQRRDHSEKLDVSRHIIPLSNESGVYFLYAEVNEVPMKFIFDTGASTISMSLTEAQFLYKQSLLTDEDFKGTVNFQDANGCISEGLIVNLKKVKIGDVVLRDVSASIVGNQEAPLLLGQSALKRLGRISIDYQANQLIIEQ